MDLLNLKRSVLRMVMKQEQALIQALLCNIDDDDLQDENQTKKR